MDIIKSIIAVRKEQDGQRPRVTVNNDNINETIWHDGNPTNITNQQILDKQVELKADYDAKQYQRDRAKEYPTWQDQLDMLWHDKKDGTTTWEDAVQAVKDANPKP